MKFLGLLLLVAGACSAAPVAGGDCDSGSLSEFVDLGSAGCNVDGWYTLRNWSFTLHSGTLDPAQISVAPTVPIGANLMIDYLGNFSVGPNETLDFSVSYERVPGTPAPSVIKLFAFSPVWQGANTVSWYANGQQLMIFTNEPRNSPGSWLPIEQVGGLLPAVTTYRFVFTAGPGGSIQNLGIREESENGALYEAVPEPGTWALLGVGLGVIVARRRFSVHT